jgi:hypothetical protein
MAVDDMLLLLWLSKLLRLLWLSRLLLLWLNRLLLLAWVSVECQLTDGETTSSALMSDTMKVNHLHFRNRRV